MTRDEIEKLSDIELSVMVATEVMGWRNLSDGEHWNGIEDGFHADKHGLVHYPHIEYGDDGDWNPSSDIAAAMQVEERVDEMGLANKYCEMMETICLEPKLDDDSHWAYWSFIHATPRERCIAALLAKMQP